METDFNPNNLTYGFIGLGLIGGSIAKALRKAYENCTIIAYNRSEEPRRLALADGTANMVTDRVDETFCKCDFIFLCTPVRFNESYFKILSDIAKPDCIITDVGSVKGNIHEAAAKAGLNRHFIGGHPMAGSEKTGFENSSASICKGAVYPVTPSGFNRPEDVEKYIKILKDIGFEPVLMSCDEHDMTTAAISHLPHLIAAELTLLVRDNDTEKQYMKKLASGGFRDTTRIAASSPDVWKQICTANSENISKLLSQYIERLSSLKEIIDSKDSAALEKLFSESGDYRRLF